MENKNQVVVSKSQVQKIGEQYVASIADNFKRAGITLNHSQSQSIMFAVQKASQMLKEKEISWQNVDFSSITTALSQVALCEVNMMAYQQDAYFLLRYVDKNTYKLEFNPQGNGIRSLVQKFGVGVKEVRDPWIVKENDDFSYPHFKGLEMTDPEWSPKGSGKCLRVVIPIIYNDGHVEYKIAEREDVKTNLLAHISNNLTNGKKEERNPEGFLKLAKKAESMTLDEMLNDNEFQMVGKMSPSWRGTNKEQMVITKMIKNALNRIPLDMKFFEIAGTENPLDAEIPVYDLTEEPSKAIEDELQKSLPAPKEEVKAEIKTPAKADVKATSIEDDEDNPF